MWKIELMHHVLALIVGLIEHGEVCKETGIVTGVDQFCKA